MSAKTSRAAVPKKEKESLEWVNKAQSKYTEFSAWKNLFRTHYKELLGGLYEPLIVQNLVDICKVPGEMVEIKAAIFFPNYSDTRYDMCDTFNVIRKNKGEKRAKGKVAMQRVVSWVQYDELLDHFSSLIVISEPNMNRSTTNVSDYVGVLFVCKYNNPVHLSIIYAPKDDSLSDNQLLREIHPPDGFCTALWALPDWFLHGLMIADGESGKNYIRNTVLKRYREIPAFSDAIPLTWGVLQALQPRQTEESQAEKSVTLICRMIFMPLTRTLLENLGDPYSVMNKKGAVTIYRLNTERDVARLESKYKLTRADIFLTDYFDEKNIAKFAAVYIDFPTHGKNKTKQLHIVKLPKSGSSSMSSQQHNKLFTLEMFRNVPASMIMVYVSEDELKRVKSQDRRVNG